MATLPRTHIYRVERRTDRDGKILFFIIPSSDRRRSSKFFDPEEAPAIEGRAARFEIECRGKVWRFLRRIEEGQA